MDRANYGNGLAAKIDSLFNYLGRAEDPRMGFLRARYQLFNSRSGSDAPWQFLDFLNEKGHLDLYGKLMSARQLSQSADAEKPLDLVQILLPPALNSGLNTTKSAMVIPFSADIADDDKRARLSRHGFPSLDFDYNPKTAEKNSPEYGQRSGRESEYSPELSYSFMGKNLDTQRKNAKTGLERILAISNESLREFSVSSWNERSSANPNEPDYIISLNVGGNILVYHLKILRDRIVIIPGNHESYHLNKTYRDTLANMSKNIILIRAEK